MPRPPVRYDQSALGSTYQDQMRAYDRYLEGPEDEPEKVARLCTGCWEEVLVTDPDGPSPCCKMPMGLEFPDDDPPRVRIVD